jgi:hypothetical protein
MMRAKSRFRFAQVAGRGLGAGRAAILAIGIGSG